MFVKEVSEVKDECGILGIWGQKDAARIAYYGLHSLQHRGQDGAGMVAKNGETLVRHKGLGLLAEIFEDKHFAELHGNTVLGHVLYSPGGKPDQAEIQPLLFHFGNTSMAICHNGNFVNAPSLREKMERAGSIFQSNSNSELLAHLIRKTNHFSFTTSVKRALQQVKGAFACAILTQNELIAARDPHGIRPLAIGRLGHSYVIASETCAFDIIGADYVRDVTPGEVVIINDRGLRSESFTNAQALAVCAMEYVYIARPDSNIEGINIHTSRKNTGRVLARESPVVADVVVPSPDSGMSAAIGYAEESGIPYELGIIRNRYVGRTFIAPSQDLRELGVKMKLSAVRSIVGGKSVVVVDDSIVRGTTTKRLATLLREAGAREIHLKIASPLFIDACYYGIDIPSRSELISHKITPGEIADYIGVESLAYVSMEGFASAVGIPVDGKNRGLCMGCFSSEYPTDLFDFSSD